MNVRIIFQTPRRENPPAPATTHERCLKGVPRSMAEQMVRDVTAYEETPTEADRQKTYVYAETGPNGETNERLIALDLTEILNIVVTDGECSPSAD